MEIAEVISRIGIKGARWIEENLDEQYKALSFFWAHISDPEAFLKLVVLNSVVSFQLSSKGEAWWWEFSQHFSENPPENLCPSYTSFLLSSRTNRRLLGLKLRRIERLCPVLEETDILPYYTRMMDLRNFIARTLSTNPSSKTVVFSVKMFGYGARIATGTFVPYPFDVPIPVDSRIKRFTQKLTREDPIAFWNEVSRQSGVPPLHIDSILWPLIGNVSLRGSFLRRFGSPGRELLHLIETG